MTISMYKARLFPDMFPLARQVRAATDHAINACGRLAGVELPTFANTEASFPELEERVAKTIEFINRSSRSRSMAARTRRSR